MDRIDLFIDTDVGGDIDDALCLAMALNSPQVDLKGVSTVYAGSQWRTELTRHMLRAFGREAVPVYRGAERPLIGRFPHDQGAEPGENQAVAGIVRFCREHRGGTMLAIGPLTNLALALHLAPDIASSVHFVIMGGVTGSSRPEWNICCDPEAADVVLSRTHPRLVGLDITEQCRLTREEAVSLVEGDDPRLRFLKGQMDRFFSTFDFLPTLHDPLALACVLRDDLVSFEEKQVAVELCGRHTRGATVVTQRGTGSALRYGVAVRAREATDYICRLVRGELGS